MNLDCHHHLADYPEYSILYGTFKNNDFDQNLTTLKVLRLDHLVGRREEGAARNKSFPKTPAVTINSAAAVMQTNHDPQMRLKYGTELPRFASKALNTRKPKYSRLQLKLVTRMIIQRMVLTLMVMICSMFGASCGRRRGRKRKGGRTPICKERAVHCCSLLTATHPFHHCA